LKSSKVLGLAYGETKLGQGRDAVKSLIKDNPELADELEVKIKERIKELAEA
jgi:recombination protein RecA